MGAWNRSTTSLPPEFSSRNRAPHVVGPHPKMEAGNPRFDPKLLVYWSLNFCTHLFRSKTCPGGVMRSFANDSKHTSRFKVFMATRCSGFPRTDTRIVKHFYLIVPNASKYLCPSTSFGAVRTSYRLMNRASTSSSTPIPFLRRLQIIHIQRSHPFPRQDIPHMISPPDWPTRCVPISSS